MNMKQPLTILFATQTGNTMAVAESIEEQAISHGFDCTLIDMLDCTINDLLLANHLILAVSTQGKGQPPFDAQELYTVLHSDKAPLLKHLHYSVIALGDSKYEFFCKAGKDFDFRLEQLGAHRFHPRADCDADYAETAQQWTESVLRTLLKSLERIPPHLTDNGNKCIQPQQLSEHLKHQQTALPLIKRTLLSGNWTLD